MLKATILTLALSTPALAAARDAAPTAPTAAPTPAPTIAPSATPVAAPTAAAMPASVAPPTAETSAAKPAAEMTKLQFLDGERVHEEIYHPGPMGPGGKGAARSKSAWILGKQHLYLIYKSNSPYGEYEGRGLVGWDAEARTYRLDWFDAAGRALRYTGGFNPEGALVFYAEYPKGGEIIKQQLTVTPQDGSRVLVVCEMAIGDQPMKMMLESLAAPAPPAAAPTPAAPAAPTPTAPATSTPAAPTPTPPAPAATAQPGPQPVSPATSAPESSPPVK